MCAVTRPSDAGSGWGAGTGRPLDLISSRRNPLVARLRALHQAKGRRDQQQVLLEGTHLLQEAARLALEPDLVVATEAWLDRQGSWLETWRGAVRLQPVTPEVMAAIASTDHPDGVVAALALPPPSRPEPLASLGGGPGSAALVLALDRLQDPGNLGTLMRTALAAGVAELWLAGGADPWQPKVMRASAGAALALASCRLEPEGELEPLLRQCRAAGVQVVAAVVQAGTPSPPPYWQLDWTRPTVLLLGSEGAGLAAPLAALASHRVTIPHAGAVESLNVAVAAAPLLLERWRQRCGGGAPPAP